MKKRRNNRNAKKKPAKNKDREIRELKNTMDSLVRVNNDLGDQIKELECRLKYEQTKNPAKKKDIHMSEEAQKMLLAANTNTKLNKLFEDLRSIGLDKDSPDHEKLNRLISFKQNEIAKTMDELRHLRYELAKHKINKEVPKKRLDEVMGIAAAKIAKDIDANCVISIERKGKDSDDDYLDVQVSIFRKLEESKESHPVFEKMEYLTKMRKAESDSTAPIMELLMEAIKHKYIEKGDRLVCVQDTSVGKGYKGLLFLYDVDDDFYNISAFDSNKIRFEIIAAVWKIVSELSKEGKKGRKVGTAFIIGNPDELKPYINQMILNPFQSYPEDERNITDPKIKETVKNFAMLDGVFVIDTQGNIRNAGAYINLDASVVNLPGFGTRHKNSAALTKITDCIAIVVAESSGEVSMFKKGKIVTKLTGKKSNSKGDIHEMFEAKHEKFRKKTESNKRSCRRHSRHNRGHAKRRKSRHTKR